MTAVLHVKMKFRLKCFKPSLILNFLCLLTLIIVIIMIYSLNNLGGETKKYFLTITWPATVIDSMLNDFHQL